MTEKPAFPTSLALPARRESGSIEDSVSFSRRLLKNGGAIAPAMRPGVFPESVRLHGNGPVRNITNAGTGRDLAGFVLNAPLSSVICH
ncbi:MAG: hypothetical protein ABI192_09105 [Bradyrhizobium sp.]